MIRNLAALAVLAGAVVVTNATQAAVIIGLQNFNPGGQIGLLSSSQTPPLATTVTWAAGDFWGSGARGSWPQGAPPSMPFGFADDSLFDISGNGVNPPFPTDTLGIVDSTWALDDGFLGAADTINAVNTAPVSAEFEFDIAGYSGLSVCVDMAAAGDFEATGTTADMFTWSYSIDGSSLVTLFTGTTNEAIDQTYLMEVGATPLIADPMTVFDGIGTTVLHDRLQTISAAIPGTGSSLVLRVEGQVDGEAFLFDNIKCMAIPEPSAAILAGLGLLALCGLGLRKRFA